MRWWRRSGVGGGAETRRLGRRRECSISPGIGRAFPAAISAHDEGGAAWQGRDAHTVSHRHKAAAKLSDRAPGFELHLARRVPIGRPRGGYVAIVQRLCWWFASQQRDNSLR